MVFAAMADLRRSTVLVTGAGGRTGALSVLFVCLLCYSILCLLADRKCCVGYGIL